MNKFFSGRWIFSVQGVLIAALLGSAAAPAGAAFKILPDQAELTIDDEVQFAGNAGEGVDVMWSVTDPVVASIDEDGLLTGLSEGQCRVIGLTSVGERDTTDVIQVASFELLLPDGDVILGPTSIRVPVAVDRSISDLQIYGFELKIEFGEGPLVFVGATADETLSSAWGQPVFRYADDQLHIAHAGAVPIVGEGALVQLEFAITGAAEAGDRTTLEALRVQFNEGSPIALTRGTTLTLVNDPEGVFGVSVDPEETLVAAGGFYDFDVFVNTQGDESVTWAVAEGPVGGAVDAEGVYSAPKDLVSTGTFHVVATSVYNPNVWGSAEVTVTPATDAPFLRLSAFPNPARARSVQLVLSASETLSVAPVVQADGAAVAMSATDTAQTVWTGTLNVGELVSSVTVQASATGSSSSGSVSLTLQF